MKKGQLETPFEESYPPAKAKGDGGIVANGDIQVKGADVVIGAEVDGSPTTLFDYISQISSRG